VDSLVGPTLALRTLGRDDLFDIEFHEQRLLKTGRNVRVEPPGLSMGGERFLEQSGVPARVDESGEEFGIIAVARGLAEKPGDRFTRPTGIGLEIRVELVRHRESRI
jgi:hypothetical protein